MPIVLFVKVIHITSLILWLGTLFVLLFLLAFAGTWWPERVVLQGTVKKMMNRVDLPLMIIAITTGAVLLSFQQSAPFKEGWFHMKMTALLGLVAIDSVLRMYKTSVPQTTARILLGLFVFCLLCALTSIYVIKFLKPTVN